MPPVGFKPTISAGEQPQTYAFDVAATGTGITTIYCTEFAPLNVSALTINNFSDSGLTKLSNSYFLVSRLWQRCE
jgi:hypothetical protein